jgi:hypothetical protein
LRDIDELEDKNRRKRGYAKGGIMCEEDYEDDEDWEEEMEE